MLPVFCPTGLTDCVFFQFSVIFPFSHLIFPPKRFILYSVTVDETVRAHYKPLYFSKCVRNRPSRIHVCVKLTGMYPVRSCLYDLPDAFTYFDAVLGRTSDTVLGSVRLFCFKVLEHFQPCWIPQRKSCDPEIIVPSISQYHFRVRGSSFLAYRGFFLIFFEIPCKKAEFRESQ